MRNEGCGRAIGFLQLVRQINVNCLAVHQKQTNEGSSQGKKKEKKKSLEGGQSIEICQNSNPL